ncbi:uncharacterized protein LOC134531596 [Bacillus rossius redtenbacheri]|uniref:uncharacterized protein LOC134531596 n=1 Tax=Bacillus rossius redtenbacheri TaxID=93214 RepID=UPI002FDE6CDF
MQCTQPCLFFSLTSSQQRGPRPSARGRALNASLRHHRREVDTDDNASLQTSEVECEVKRVQVTPWTTTSDRLRVSGMCRGANGTDDAVVTSCVIPADPTPEQSTKAASFRCGSPRNSPGHTMRGIQIPHPWHCGMLWPLD